MPDEVLTEEDWRAAELAGADPAVWDGVHEYPVVTDLTVAIAFGIASSLRDSRDRR